MTEVEDISIGYWYSKQHGILLDNTYRIKLQVAKDLNVPYYSVQIAAKLLRSVGLRVNYPSLLAAVYFLNKKTLSYNYVMKILRTRRVKGKKLFKLTLAMLKQTRNSIKQFGNENPSRY